MKYEIKSHVENGKLTRNKPLIIDAIKSLEGKDVVITIEKSKKKRSNQQNRYMWGCLLPIVQNGLKDATGEFRTLDNIHYNILLKMFSPQRELINTETGECITENITSSEMTTTEYMSYIQDIQKWAAEFLGINIPNPNEELEMF